MSLCAKVCKLFQEDDKFVYNINNAMVELIKNLQDAYTGPSMPAQYFIEFEKILTEFKADNHGLYKNHDSVFNKGRNIEEQQFLERKPNTIIRGLANNIIEKSKKLLFRYKFYK